MLRPIETPSRDRRGLRGLWHFRADNGGAGMAEQWWTANLQDSRLIPVPSSINDLFLDGTRDLVGIAWYQRDLQVPRSWSDERIVLRFDSATHAATVWIDDTEVAQHVGGYLPFEVDITELVSAGASYRLTVAVDNRLTWATIPPGEIVKTSTGRDKQTYLHDFYNYAGLHREVWLYTTPRSFIQDVTVVTDIDGTDGLVRYDVEVAGDAAASVRLTDEDGVEVASATGAQGELRVGSPKLWNPGAAYLYRLEVTAGEDVYWLNVGIRTVKVQGTEFLINGQPFRFKGFGKHEDNILRGKAHDDVMMVHDFELMRWIGANSFRTSHYPYAEEVLDYADRMGFVVVDESPAVGQNLAVSGGMLGVAPRPTWSEETIGSAAQQAHLQVMRELIARDKNHACVVMWSIANEPDSGADGAEEYFVPVIELTRQLDPSRPISFANVMLARPHQCKISPLVDVLSLNRYYGWYVDLADLASAEIKFEHELRAWTTMYDKPIIFSEYGADAVAGLHSLHPMPFSEEYQVDLLEMTHNLFDKFPAVIGEQVWAFSDFMTTNALFRVEGNKKGVFTRDRKPKAAAHALRRRWTKE